MLRPEVKLIRDAVVSKLQDLDNSHNAEWTLELLELLATLSRKLLHELGHQLDFN